MQLISRLGGYVCVTYPEKVRSRLFRALHGARIAILETRTTSDGFSVTLSRASYKRLAALKESESLSPLGVREGGLPIRTRAILRRPGLLLGVLLGVMLFFFCRGRIWEIRIVGDGSIDEDAMRTELALHGLHEGMSIRELDGEETVSAYLSADRRVSWMQIRREGVVAYVEWLPTKFGEEAVSHPEGVGANLVASEDAVVEDLRISDGTAVVGRGSVVKAGELLVSGLEAGGVSYASGEVIGRVRQTVRVFVPFLQTGETVTGEARAGLRLTVFDFPLSFGYGEKAPDAIRKSAFWLFDRIRLPIYTESELIYRTEEYEHTLNESEAVKLAQRRLAAELETKLSRGELLSQKTVGSFSNEGYTLTAEIEYLINIAKTLEFSAENE